MSDQGKAPRAAARFALALAIIFAVALTGCSGQAEQREVLPQAASAVPGCPDDAAAGGVLCPPARVAEPAARSALTVYTPTFTDLLQWAEATYPVLFPGHPSGVLTSGPYTYRFYAQTGNYIGYASGGIYILGPVSGNALRFMGQLTDFTCSISPDSCKSPPVCPDGVYSGYVGTYSDTGGAGGSDGGGDGAAGDGGYFVNTRVQVELADGTLLGEALTDSVKGMVTICGGRTGQPVKITFLGSSSAQYFDEARGKLVPFPAGEAMHVVVPQISQNIGATAFTEAAYQYLVAKYGVNGWRQAANVAEANSTVQAEINRSLRDSLSVADITRLTIAYRGPATSTIDTSANGVYAAVNSGLAFAAGEYNTTVADPATQVRNQLAADMTDGRIDGYSSSGARVTGAGGQTYDPTNLRERWLGGANRVTQAFGTAQARQAADQTVRVTQLMTRFDTQGVQQRCPVSASDMFPAQYYLSASGKVTAAFDPTCGRAAQPLVLPAPVSQMFQGGGGDNVFFLLNDGRLYVMGMNGNGNLGLNDRLPRFVPVPLTGISNIANLFAAEGDVVAVTTSGAVYAWGGYNDRHSGFGGATGYVPEKIAGLPLAVMAVTQRNVIAVLGVDGRVYTLGLFNNCGLYGDGTPSTAGVRLTPTAIPTLSDVVSLAAPQVGTLTFGENCNFLALRRDKTVWAWGDNGDDLLGTGLAQPQTSPERYLTRPAQVQGLAGTLPRQIGATVALGAYALMDDGSIWRWGANFTDLSTKTQRAGFMATLDGTAAIASYKSLLTGFTLALTNDGQLVDFIYNFYVTPTGCVYPGGSRLPAIYCAY
jgi:hypothetical protein